MNAPKPIVRRSIPAARILSCAVSLLPGLASAATYNWAGGAGNWDIVTPNWSGAGTVWPTTGTDNDAAFGGAAGAVTTVGTVLFANDLAFTTTGYVIGGDRLTLNGTTPTLNVGAGVAAAINAPLSGTGGILKTGAGTLTLGGASIYTGSTTVGGGTLALGAGGLIRNNNQTYVGPASGAGTLTISGGHLYSETANVFGVSIGTTSGQPGVLNISSGTLTMANSGGGIVMGSGANATFNQTGGNVTLGAGFYLANGGGGNTSTFNQSGGNFTTGGTLRVGQTAGGIGVFNLSAGTFNVAGNNPLVYVGESGTGTLTVSGTGVLNSTSEIWVGQGGATGAGTINLNGGTLNNNGILLVVGGNTAGGTGRFIQTGGSYTQNGNNGIYIGNSSGTSGTMTLSGGSFTHFGPLGGGENRIRIGSNTGGSGTLNVGGTAALTTNAEMWIGGPAGTGAGTLNISGGSVAQSGQHLVVGNSATSSYYNQTGGSYLFTGTSGVYIGNGSSGAGTMNISGGTFTQTQGLFRVGQNGTATGTMNLGGGGGAATMTVPTVTFAANSASAAGTFNLLSNGNLTAAMFNRVGAGTFNFNGGTLRPNAANATFMTGLTAANVQAGGAIVDNNGFNITIGQALLDGGGGGGLTKNGYGTLTLSGASTYTGTTTVNTGLANVTGSLASTTLDMGVTYGSGATKPSTAGLLVLAGNPSLTGRTVTSHTFSGTGASSTDYLTPILSLPGGFTGSPTVTAPGVSGQSIQQLGNTFFLTNTGGSNYLWNDSTSGSAITDGVSLNTTWDAATATSWRQSDDGTQTNVAWGGAGKIANFGVASAAAGSITVSGTVSASGLAFNPAGSGNYTLAGGTVAFGSVNGALNANGTDATVNSILTGSNGITKSGTGILTLSGVNAYTGNTVVSQGELRSQGNSATQGTITLGDANTGANNVSWLFNGSGTPSNPIVVSSQGTGQAIIGTFSGGTSTTHTGPVTLNRATIFSDGTGDRTSYTGLISGNVGTLTIAGNRTTLDNAGNNFTGGITVNSGATLQVNAAGAIPNASAVTSAGNFYLNIGNGNSETIGSLAGTGTTSVHPSVSGTQTLIVGADNTSTTYSGAMGNGGGVFALTKTGTGTQILTGTSTYTGATTINDGVLQIGNGVNTGAINNTSGITIGAAGTLRWYRNDNGLAPTNNHSGSGTLHYLGTDGPGSLSQSSMTLTQQNNTSFTGTMIAEKARFNATQADDFGSAALRVDSGGQFLFNAIPSFSNNVTVNDTTGWYEASSLNLSALRYQGTVAHSGNIVLNQPNRSLLGDNNGENTTISAYATSDVTLSGIISGAGEFSMNRYTSWNGGTTQPVLIRLAGAANNTYTGKTIVNGQGANASLWLQKTGGAIAIPANTTVQMGNGTGGAFNIRMGGNEQFGSGVVMDFVNLSGQWGRFDLKGTTQTLAGINAGSLVTQGGGVIQNQGIDNVVPAGDATLTLNGSGNYLYNGFIRDQDNSGTARKIILAKSGAGTQTLIGGVVTYTGATSITGGTLELRDTTAFASAINVGPSGTLNVTRSALGFGSRSALMANAVTGSGIININNDGAGIAGGWAIFGGATSSLNFTGTVNVNSGTLSRDNVQVNTINGTATVNVAAGAAFGAGRGGNSTIGALNGAGVVSTLWSGSNAGSITIGNGGGSGNFTGTIQGNGSNGTDGTLEGGVLSVIKTGAGTQTFTSANNTYSGATTINQGMLVAAGGGAIGNASAVSLANDATALLQLNASETVGSLAGGGATGGNVNLQGNTLTAGGNNGTTSYAGVLSGAGGSLVKTGTGTLTLTNSANSHSGTTTVQQGTLQLSGTGGTLGLGALPSAANAINLGGTIPGPLNVAGTLRVSGGDLTPGTDRGLTLAGLGGTLDIDATRTMTLAGNIAANVGGSTLTKAGAGTFNLTGNGTINALVVAGGTYNQTAGTTSVSTTSTGVKVTTGATYKLTGGILRTDMIKVEGTGVFEWGGGTLTHNQPGAALPNNFAAQFTSAGYQQAYAGTTMKVEGAAATITTTASTVLALHASPSLYSYGTDVMFNNLYIQGDLNLTAGGSLEVEINPYLLRPYSPGAGSGAIEFGSLPLVVVDGNLTGQFTSFGTVLADSQGFTQYTGIFSGAAALDSNTWYLEYAQDVNDPTGSISGQGAGVYDLIFFHYRVTGYVPEPASFGLLAAGTLGLRLMRTLQARRKRLIAE